LSDGNPVESVEPAAEVVTTPEETTQDETTPVVTTQDETTPVVTTQDETTQDETTPVVLYIQIQNLSIIWLCTDISIKGAHVTFYFILHNILFGGLFLI
jgi:hypothetical protein